MPKFDHDKWLEDTNPTLKDGIDWQLLRKKFFNECTEIYSENNNSFNCAIRRINIAPHDLFEWFKKNIEV